VPNDLVFKATNSFHRAVMTVTAGRLGWKAWGMPVLELTTVGRKSGEPRTVLLTSPFQEGDTLVIAASKGGDVHHPAWFLNLQENSAVEVKTKGHAKRPMTARIASSEERARLWPLITERHANYAGYQKKTDREIPLVLLIPAD